MPGSEPEARMPARGFQASGIWLSASTLPCDERWQAAHAWPCRWVQCIPKEILGARQARMGIPHSHLVSQDKLTVLSLLR